jgi:hypothetical protein
MNSRIKDLLKMAAEKDQRTMASLIEKIFHDFLEKDGFLTKPDFNTETREHHRTGVMLPVKTLCKTNGEECIFSGVVVNVSSGGAMVLFPKGFGVPFESGDEYPRFELCVESPKSGKEICFDCETKHWALSDNQVQLGAAFVNPKKESVQALNHWLE